MTNTLKNLYISNLLLTFLLTHLLIVEPSPLNIYIIVNIEFEMIQQTLFQFLFVHSSERNKNVAQK